MIVGWIILAVVLLLVFMFLVKSQDLIGVLVVLKKNIFYIILIAVVAFLAFSLFQINNKYHVSPTSFDGFAQTMKVYYLWAQSVFSNIGNIAGYTIKQDWWLNKGINVTSVK